MFGPTDPARNGPFASGSIVLRSPASTTSYSHVPRPDDGLLEISAEQVVAAARQLLEELMASWSAIARRIRVPLGFVFALLYFWLAKPTVKSILIGTALVIPGLLIRALASGQLQKNEQLATGGPYAYTRNPLYLGSLILAIGFALASRSWWIVAGIFFSSLRSMFL